jgi:hypothetical protein
MCALAVLAIVPCLASGAEASNAGKKSKNLVHGSVVSMQKDGDKAGSITISVHHGKKAAATAPVEKTFKISAGTTFQIVQGKKGAVETKTADFSAIEKGSKVLIVLNGTEATSVKIIKKGKGKKKNV